MPIPSTHRWIALGNLSVRTPKRAAQNAPNTDLDEIIEHAKTLVQSNNQYREHGSENSRLMWFSNFDEHNDYYVFLAEVGDKNTSGVSFIDFDTRETRDIAKLENEGGHFAGHVAISKSANEVGGHLVLIERVPGIYLSSVKNHFSWLSRADQLRKHFVDDNGKPRTVRPVCEILGHQSNTIRDALQSGVLQDIEFISSEESHEDGLDEEPIVREVVRQVKWEIKKRVTEDQADGVFGQMKSFFREKFSSPETDAAMFVRIKANSGQIKRTEVMDSEESVLEQAFAHNELISDFDQPLEQRHARLRDDIIEKMLAIPDKLQNGAGGD